MLKLDPINRDHMPYINSITNLRKRKRGTPNQNKTFQTYDNPADEFEDYENPDGLQKIPRIECALT